MFQGVDNMKYSRGIYCYFDTKSKTVVYIGKDSHIDKQHRKTQHTCPSKYNVQKINMILQKNPCRYVYFVLANQIKSEKELNFMEKYFIKLFNPKFNFTDGGDGRCGSSVTEKTKQKLRELMTGKKVSEETKKKISNSMSGKNNPMYGKHHTAKTKQKISEKNSGKNSAWYGKKHTHETKQKISEAQKGKKHSRESVLRMRKNKAKYNLWNASKVTYVKQAMFSNNPNLNYLRKCFIPRYEGYKLSIGLYHDFVTCEIVNDLIKEECG